MNIYIANLNSSINDEALKNLFTPFGAVLSAAVVNDVFTGESRGFGYVEMENEESAQQAIESLNHSTVAELTISVKEAEPTKTRQGSYKVGNGPVDMYKFRKN